MTVVRGDARERLLEAAYRCVARQGLAKTSVEDIVREAGVSRPTAYRHFPGGRDAILRDVIGWEASRFFARVLDAVAGVDDLEALTTNMLAAASRAIEHHQVLQTVLVTEPDRLLPPLVTGVDRLIALLQPRLADAARRAPLRAGVDPDLAADYLARMVLSVVASPAGRDLTDPATVRAYVRGELLAGIVALDG